jgi:hypothetical protein
VSTLRSTVAHQKRAADDQTIRRVGNPRGALGFILRVRPEQRIACALLGDGLGEGTGRDDAGSGGASASKLALGDL